MTDDLLDGHDPIYTLTVRADSDRDALVALDSARIAVSRFDVRAVPGRSERVLTIAFAFGDGSEWDHDVEAFRVPVEQRLNGWLIRDRDQRRLPKGALLWWRRGG